MCNVKITGVHLTRAGFKKRVLQRFPVRSRGQRSSPACPDPPLLSAPTATSWDSCLCAPIPRRRLRLYPQEDRSSPCNREGGAPKASLAWAPAASPRTSRIKHRNFEVFEVRETPTLQRPGGPFHPGDACALVRVGRLPYSAQFPGGAHTRVTGICGQQAARMLPRLQGLQWRRNPESS